MIEDFNRTARLWFPAPGCDRGYPHADAEKHRPLKKTRAGRIHLPRPAKNRPATGKIGPRLDAAGVW